MTLKAKYNYIYPFSRMPLVRIHLFFSVNFSYIRGSIHSHPHMSFVVEVPTPNEGLHQQSIGCWNFNKVKSEFRLGRKQWCHNTCQE